MPRMNSNTSKLSTSITERWMVMLSGVARANRFIPDVLLLQAVEPALNVGLSQT